MRIGSLILASTLAGIFLVGCSTPEKRAEERPEAFAKLSKKQQRLVLEGQIQEGMNEDAVYIALGRPSKQRNARKDGKNLRYWVYGQLVSREIPRYRHHYYRGKDGRVRRHAYYDPYYDSFVVDTFRVIFQNGKVVGWEELY